MARRGECAAHLYGLLLRLYPQGHREAFSEPMLQAFRDHYHDAVQTNGGSPLGFWLGVLVDEGRSLVREYISALRTTLAWVLRTAFGERTGSMKTGGSVVLAVVAGLLLLLGVRIWLSPTVLSAPHGGGTALSSVIGLALLLLAYALVAFGLSRVRMGASGPQSVVATAALRRATLMGAILGGGALAAIAVDTLGNFESSISLALWALVILVAPFGWGWAGLMATRTGGSWRLGIVAALWSGMVSALVGATGEVASTLLALPRLVQHELSNPDYLYWHQSDVQSYAIASALAVGMIGLILAPLVAGIAGGIGSGLGKSGGSEVLEPGR